MPKIQNLREIRNLLVELYPDPPSTRRIVDDAGFNPSAISFNTSITNIWDSILIEAEKHDKLKELLSIISSEYPNNATLLKLLNTYNQNKNQEFQEQIGNLEHSIQSLKEDLSALTINDNGQELFKQQLDEMFDKISQLQKASQGMTAQVILPPIEDMQVHLVTSNSLDRLEEYRNDQATWFALAGLFGGSILGILINWVTGGQMNSSAIILIVAFAIITGVFGYFYYESKVRITNVKDKIGSTLSRLPFEVAMTEKDWQQGKDGSFFYRLEANKHKKGRFPHCRFYHKLPDGIYQDEVVNTQISQNGDVKILVPTKLEGTLFVQ
jgi:flagellar hook-basal body complex protein FliE